MLLVYSQIKHRCRRNDMVEDVALDFLIVDPLLITAEGIDLQRHAKLGGLHLPHHHGQVVVQLGVVVEVGLDVGAEDAEVGLLAPVHNLACVDFIGLIVFFYVFLTLDDIVLYEGIVFIFLQHFRRAVTDGVHIDVDGARDTSSARFRHSAPIGKGRRNQRVGRDGGNGVVPALHFYRSEVDFQYVTIGRTNGNPIAYAEHVVDRELDATHKSLDGVLENKYDDGRHGAHTNQDSADFGAQHISDNNQNREDVEHDLDDLYQPGDRLDF